MSVAVELAALEEQVSSHGPMALLVTVNEDGRPHAVAVEVTWREGTLCAGAGSRTAANIDERPGVSLLWPVLAPGRYSLIVDGRAEVEGDEVVVRPGRAVLHRTPVGASGADADADADAPSCIKVLPSA